VAENSKVVELAPENVSDQFVALSTPRHNCLWNKLILPILLKWWKKSRMYAQFCVNFLPSKLGYLLHKSNTKNCFLRVTFPKQKSRLIWQVMIFGQKILFWVFRNNLDFQWGHFRASTSMYTWKWNQTPRNWFKHKGKNGIMFLCLTCLCMYVLCMYVCAGEIV
jgi:hypothetical protein